MSDLISRNAVIDVLKETGIIQDNDLGHLVVGEIERIPTAYDVDRVVEELGLSKIVVSSIVSVSSYNLAIRRAIEIVKGGGVNE